MPVKVVTRTGAKPYKIVEVATGKVKGSSATKAEADASARVRNAIHFSGGKWKPAKGRK